MADFFNQFQSLLRTAFTTGIESQPLSFKRAQQGHLTQREIKRFYSGCHRGYDKAQKRIVSMITELRAELGLSDKERTYRELLLRKTMDGIATTFLRDRIHLMRRLGIHDDAPSVDLRTLGENLNVANKLNEESRMTFAIVADLTTFIHIADILRIDFRNGPPQVSLIEVKTGKVNKMLLDKLEDYRPTPEDLSRLRNDQSIEPRYAKQAQRMLRQKIRCAQVEQILRTDVGADLQLNKPVVWSREETKLPTYGDFLDDLCCEAVKQGNAAGTVAKCLHLGIGFGQNEGEAKRYAIRSVNWAIHNSRLSPPEGLTTIVEEISKVVPPSQMFTLTDNVLSNLNATAVKPFVQWGLKRDHIHSLAQRKMVVLMAFDLAGFIWLCRHIVKMEVTFETRQETAKLAQEFGANNIMSWGGRALAMKSKNGWNTIGGGILSRFANDLSNPLVFMSSCKEDSFPSALLEAEVTETSD